MTSSIRNPQWCAERRATIVAIEPISPSVMLFRLRIEGPPLTFLAGQWAELSVSDGGQVLSGAFSITSPPTDAGTIELAIKRADRYPITRFLFTGARVGDTACISEGRGSMGYDDSASGPLVLIAGGTGIAPMLSILRYVQQRNPQQPVTLLHSAATRQELLFSEEIQRIAAAHDNVRYWATLTREQPAGWEGLHGRIDGARLRQLALDPLASYYLCGPPRMVDDVAAALTGLGVPPARMRFDKWW